MKIEEYRDIVKTIQKFRGLEKDCAKMLFLKYSSVNKNAIYSILNQETQMRMKFTHRKVFQLDNRFYDRYLEAVKRGEPTGILVRIAIEFNTCPALLARKVLESHCKWNPKENEDSAKNSITKMMRDTTLIQDPRLSYEIYTCILYDNQYGAVSNAISDSIGEEYEVKLENYLIERNVPYYNEDHLRTKGYDKTPDCKLEIPIAVNGFVVNWIESKAQFASPDTHQKYIKEQFLSYWNRFGPGLVIYWFGFVDNIIQSNETRFIVMDHFPENITYMDPTSITPLST